MISNRFTLNDLEPQGSFDYARIAIKDDVQ